MKKIFMTAAVLVLSVVAICAEGAFPVKVDEYVNDYAGILKNTDRTSIAEMLRKIDYDQKAEIQVVCISSVNDFFPGVDIEEFASGLFSQWGIGSKAGRGMLLLISINDRQIALELGQAKSGVYDDIMKNVVKSKIIPQFREGDYSRGIYEGARAMSKMMETKNSLLSGPFLWILFGALVIFAAVLLMLQIRVKGKARAISEAPAEKKSTQKNTAPAQPSGFGGGAAGSW